MSQEQVVAVRYWVVEPVGHRCAELAEGAEAGADPTSWACDICGAPLPTETEDGDPALIACDEHDRALCAKCAKRVGYDGDASSWSLRCCACEPCSKVVARCDPFELATRAPAAL